jgi:hypothetical protein
MDSKKLQEFANQYYRTMRSSDPNGYKSSAEHNETLGLVCVEKHPCAERCQHCDRDLPRGFRSVMVAKNGEWQQRCATCRRLKDKESDIWRYQHEISPGELIPWESRALNKKPLGRPKKVHTQSQSLTESVLDSSPVQQPVIPQPISETVTIVRKTADFVEQVIVRDYRESLIQEYSRIPVLSQCQKCDVPDSDNEARID